jgi:hypothetical protein
LRILLCVVSITWAPFSPPFECAIAPLCIVLSIDYFHQFDSKIVGGEKIYLVVLDGADPDAFDFIPLGINVLKLVLITKYFVNTITP